jgi:hypothetical protein
VFYTLTVTDGKLDQLLVTTNELVQTSRANAEATRANAEATNKLAQMLSQKKGSELGTADYNKFGVATVPASVLSGLCPRYEGSSAFSQLFPEYRVNVQQLHDSLPQERARNEYSTNGVQSRTEHFLQQCCETTTFTLSKNRKHTFYSVNVDGDPITGYTDFCWISNGVVLLPWEDKSTDQKLSDAGHLAQILVQTEGFAEKYKKTTGRMPPYYCGILNNGIAMVFVVRVITEDATVRWFMSEITSTEAESVVVCELLHRFYGITKELESHIVTIESMMMNASLCASGRNVENDEV